MPVAVDPGLLVRLPQRGVGQVGVTRVGGAAGEGDLRGVGAHGRRPLDEQDLGTLLASPIKISTAAGRAPTPGRMATTAVEPGRVRQGRGQRPQPVRPGESVDGHSDTPRCCLACERIWSAEPNGPTCRYGDRPVRADEEGLRRAGDLQRPGQHLVLVDQLRDTSRPSSSGELDRPLRPRVLVVDAHDHQVGVVGVGHLGDERRLLPARPAPLGPDVDHHRPAAQPGQPHLAAAAQTAQHQVRQPGSTAAHVGIGARTVLDAGRLLGAAQLAGARSPARSDRRRRRLRRGRRRRTRPGPARSASRQRRIGLSSARLADQLGRLDRVGLALAERRAPAGDRAGAAGGVARRGSAGGRARSRCGRAGSSPGAGRARRPRPRPCPGRSRWSSRSGGPAGRSGCPR